MNRIAIFNPEHDLALANGDRHFIAPQNIREMGRDLASLLEFVKGDDLLVWGWDHVIKNHLLSMCVAANLLPSDDALTALRQRSGRASAHHLLTAFLAVHSMGTYAGESILVHNLDEVIPYVVQHGHIILKDPLSSSGKGLRHVKGDERGKATDFNKVKNWAEALIRRHGYLTAEPYYNKVQDFAMEFRADGDGCHFIGYSLFNTNAHGRYESNLLAPDEEIEAFLSQYVPQKALRETKTWIVEYASHIIPTEWNTTKHPLYFGIDMMIVQTTDNLDFALHPCVEINLRLNMGIIAHEVYRQLLAAGVEGSFHVSAFPTTDLLQSFNAEQIQQHPAIFHEGRLISGYHPLTLIHSDTRCHAYVLCGL